MKKAAPSAGGMGGLAEGAGGPLGGGLVAYTHMMRPLRSLFKRVGVSYESVSLSTRYKTVPTYPRPLGFVPWS